MDKFEYGAYNSQTYEHESPFADSSYIDPVNETETRKQFSYPLLELQDFINKTLPIQQDSDKVIQLRLTSDNLIQYSLDGETWLDTASGGHIIYNEDENQLPQKTKLRFDGVSVFNSGDFTIVKGIKGEQGVSVASIVQVSESSESEGLNVWRATLTDGSTFDFVVRNGHKGEQGEKGEQGNGLIILGTYASLEDLQVAHPIGNEGDLYVVGTSDSNPCYVWDTNDNAWESIGKVRGEKGAKGDKGETGAQGTSIQSIVAQESSVSGGTNIVTITLTNGAINTFNIKNGEKGEAGEGMKSGGTIGQVLTKKTSTDYDCVWATIDKDSIGLGNVDNTSDADKPISTLTQNALDNKQDTLVSGSNIKTINGDSIVGSGNLSVGSEKRKCSYATPRWLRFNPSNKRGLIIKAGTSILLANGTYKTYAVDTAVDLSSYVGEAGANYNVYLANDGTITAYTSTQSNKGVKIGRFSTLCANVGTITMKIPAKASSGLASGGTILVKQYSSEDSDFYNFYNKSISAVTVQTYYDVISCVHPLNGYVAGDILPESVFCLSFFPTNKYEDGQVYDQDTGSVIDIYLQSGNGDSTRSIYNATHQVGRQAINHQEDMRIVGKRLLTDHEFTSAAIGSNEGTNITGSSDKTTVGGHVDIAIASRRMISAIGCEEMCGYIWQWLDEIGPVGGSGWATYDGHATFGKTYGTPYVVGAGGDWSNGSYCGSRSRWCNDSRSATYESNGGRGSSRIQIGI